MVQAYEMTLMASLVKTASMHLVGGGTDPAFAIPQEL
jgi:hypothetical protein